MITNHVQYHFDWNFGHKSKLSLIIRNEYSITIIQPDEIRYHHI